MILSKWKQCSLLTILFLVFTGIAEAQPPTADHHIHIRSEDASESLLRILSEVQGREEVPIEPSTSASDVIARLDSSGTRYAALLSTAYFFAMPDLEFRNEESRTRSENDYVASQAEQAPDRLVAICAVNPLSEYALREVIRCGESGRFAGLKLHFANSDVNLRNSSHVDRLRVVFQEASQQNLAIIVHAWTRNPDFGKVDVQIFIDELLPLAQGVPVQVAHLGGPGTFSDVTAEAARTFAEAIENDKPAMENVYFDIAEVPHHPDRAGNDERRQAMEQANRELSGLIKRLGTGRVFWGTDWIAGPVEVYLSMLKPMQSNIIIWKEIHSNKAPYFNTLN